MFYFIPGIYQPNTASTNRWLAYLRFFSESSINTTAIFFRRNSEGSSILDMPHVSVKNYWRCFYFNNHYLRYFSLILYYIHFWFHLKEGDVVYCYEQADVWKLFLKKGVKVYAEYTEHPDVIGLGGKFFYTSKQQFKKKCSKLEGVFVISTALREYFIKMGLDQNKIHIINMIVDETRFDGLQKEDVEQPYIAYCGTVSNNKDGVDNLIEAFSVFSTRHPDVKLYIIGGSQSETEAANLISLIKRLNLIDRVVLTGRVSSIKMPQLLKNARILALNRPDNIQAKYGFPTKLGEYLMTGNPVVVTGVGDIPLFLTDGVSAYISRPNDPFCFSQKLCEAFENEDSSKIGMMGKSVAEKFFSYKTESLKLSRIMGL